MVMFPKSSQMVLQSFIKEQESLLMAPLYSQMVLQFSQMVLQSSQVVLQSSQMVLQFLLMVPQSSQMVPQSFQMVLQSFLVVALLINFLPQFNQLHRQQLKSLADLPMQFTLGKINNKEKNVAKYMG